MSSRKDEQKHEEVTSIDRFGNEIIINRSIESNSTGDKTYDVL